MVTEAANTTVLCYKTVNEMALLAQNAMLQCKPQAMFVMGCSLVMRTEALP